VGADIPTPILPPAIILILSTFVVDNISDSASRLLIVVFPAASIPIKVPSPTNPAVTLFVY
jgi:hypothetical protein